MTAYEVTPIGAILRKDDSTFIQLDPQWVPALKALDGFSHVNVLWWFSDFDNAEFRSVLEAEQPYKNAPVKMGIFATRSPIRPNPIALSAVEVIRVHERSGRIEIAYIDANDGTPVLDIKPYTPSLDRVERPKVPDWCEKWPKSLEASEEFDWEKVFNF